jgi:hypothetical protein
VTPLELVLDRVENARRSGSNWTARCPAHHDRQNSLSLSEGDEGRALVKCFAGCETEDIVSALRLEMRDLFEREASRPLPPVRPLPAPRPRPVPRLLCEEDVERHRRALLSNERALERLETERAGHARRWSGCVSGWIATA